MNKQNDQTSKWGFVEVLSDSADGCLSLMYEDKMLSSLLSSIWRHHYQHHLVCVPCVLYDRVTGMEDNFVQMSTSHAALSHRALNAHKIACVQYAITDLFGISDLEEDEAAIVVVPENERHLTGGIDLSSNTALELHVGALGPR